MAKLSKETIAAAKRYGHTVDDIAQQYGISGAALLAKVVSGESGDNPDAVSSAGARGRVQFMPASRDTAVQKYGVDPWSKDADQAVHAAALHLRGLINGSKGLQGYNPGSSTYTSYILGQKVGNVSGGARVRSPSPSAAPATYTAGTPAVAGTDNSGLRRQLVGQFLQQGGVQNSNAVLGLAAQYGQAQDVPGVAAVPGQKVRAPSASTRTSGGVRISPRARPGDPVVSSKQSEGGQHETAGLAGYPAHDYFAPAGTHAVAPVSGTVVKLSGHDPAQGPMNGPHGPLGWSAYIRGSDGKTYFLTHMGTRTVKVGQKVRQGQVIGTVADYDKYGTPSHIHEGVNG